MKTTERFEKVAVDRLVPYARNARTHSKEQILQLRASLREFGFVSPVIVDGDMNIIAGHGRIMAAKEEGITEVPCVFAEHLSEAQKKAYILADNRLALNAGWDEELLALEFADLAELGFDAELTGFSPDEIEQLFADDGGDDEGETAEVAEDDYDMDDVPDEPFVQSGDIWRLGKHRLMCGDSTDLNSVRLLMNGELAQITWCDPPWNVDYGGAKHPSWKKRQILNDSMSAEDFGKFLTAAFKAQAAVSVAGCMAYIAMSAQEWANVMSATAAAGYHWSSTVIWVKDSLVLSRKDYHTQYEPIYYGWLGNDKRLCPLADRQQSDVWNIPRPKRSDEHPTMKPLELVGRSLMNSSKKGDIVLDLFGGSGSTLIAAEQTERVCRTMELDPQYAAVIVERFRKFAPDEQITVERNGEVLTYDEVRQSV